jgi:hypothetical protein
MTVLPRVHPTRCRTAVQGISGNSCNSNRICGSTTSTMEPASLRTYFGSTLEEEILRYLKRHIARETHPHLLVKRQ